MRSTRPSLRKKTRETKHVLNTLLNTQISGPHHRAIKSEFLGVGY